MKHNPETLAAIGRALYGPNWQAALAEHLGVSDRTLRRWKAGEFDIPPALWGELGSLCRAHAISLNALADKLPR